MPYPKSLTCELIGWTKNPLGVLLYVWLQSRSNKETPDPYWLQTLVQTPAIKASLEETLSKKVEMLGFKKAEKCIVFLQNELKMLLSDAVPVTEHITFSFSLQNIPISLREQLVRHRIGTAFDLKVGADMVAIDHIPELASSSFWSQTSRILDQEAFFDEGRFILPESIANSPQKLDFLSVLKSIQEGYCRLAEAGVPLEDCRQLLPLATTHNMVWTLNLKSLANVVGRRTCWVSQSSLWESLLVQIVQELCIKVSPLFSYLAAPPCIKRGKFCECIVKGTNEDRIKGRDGDQAPCPLYIRYHNSEACEATDRANESERLWKRPNYRGGDIRNWEGKSSTTVELLEANAKRFERLWHFDPFNPRLEVVK
jgi:thymidylate synthase ThyX